MWGAIVGDIIGSVYEWDNIKKKDFPLFAKNSRFTDDTVMTIAVADALLNGGTYEDYVDSMKKYGNMHRHAGYGGSFKQWLDSDDPQPYNSWGNGSAMRVSPVAYFYKPTDDLESDLQIVRKAAELSAVPTHSHPSGVKGAQAVAEAIMIIRSLRNNGKNIDEIKEYVKNYIQDNYDYNLEQTLDEIRPNYSFDVSCDGTLPPAITAFLESTDFEDAVRNAVSLGGDSDTLAAITGSIAQAAYGIPDEIVVKAKEYLPDDLTEVIDRWEKKDNS